MHTPILPVGAHCVDALPILPVGAHCVDALPIFAQVGQSFALVNVSPQAV